MAKIKRLGHRELGQVLSLQKRLNDQGFDYPIPGMFQLFYVPLNWLNHWLPISWKFLPGIYVAVSQDKVLGLVRLSKDGHRVERWKIDQLIIDPDTYSAFDVGKELLSYIMTQYGAQGVETFLAFVDPFDEEGLALLKACGFRHCTKVHEFVLENLSDELKHKSAMIEGIHEARSGDARRLQELYSETLAPEVRVSLRKSPQDLHPSLFERDIRRCKGIFERRWVVSHGNRDYLLGSIGLTTHDYKQFSLSLLVSPAWAEGTEDLLCFGIQKVLQCTSSPKITVEVYDFQKTNIEVLEKLGFERQWTKEILVKDYWIPLKDRESRLKNPVLLFSKSNGTSPA